MRRTQSTLPTRSVLRVAKLRTAGGVPIREGLVDDRRPRRPVAEEPGEGCPAPSADLRERVRIRGPTTDARSCWSRLRMAASAPPVKTTSALTTAADSSAAAERAPKLQPAPKPRLIGAALTRPHPTAQAVAPVGRLRCTTMISSRSTDSGWSEATAAATGRASCRDDDRGRRRLPRVGASASLNLQLFARLRRWGAGSPAVHVLAIPTRSRWTRIPCRCGGRD